MTPGSSAWRQSPPRSSGNDGRRWATHLRVSHWNSPAPGSKLTPSVVKVRSGVQMALWAAKSIAVSFGGVFDSYDADEDDLTSVFYNELYGYQISNGPNGRWISLNLKKPKQKKKGPNKAKLRKIQQRQREEEERRRRQEEEGAQDDESADDDADSNHNTGDEHNHVEAQINGDAGSDSESEEEEDDPDDPQKTVPIARYNAMMAVQKNTLYIYGGIVESQEREYTLDDFYTLQLDKLDRFTCLKECNIAELEWKESDDDDDDDDSDSDSDESSGSDEEEGSEQAEGDGAQAEPTETLVVASPSNDDAEEPDAAALRAQATAFMGVAKNTERTAEDVMSTPMPGETLKTFYDRTRKSLPVKQIPLRIAGC